MKKIFFGLASILAIIATTSGVAFAIYRARAEVSANRFSAGVLRVTIHKGEGFEIHLHDLAPGYEDKDYRYFDVHNHGSIAAEFFLSFVKTHGSNALYDALQIEIRDGGRHGHCDGAQIYSGKIADFKALTKVSQYYFAATSSHIDDEKDNVLAGRTMRICQKISFPDTGEDQNELQDTSVSFTERIDATQDKKPDAI